MEGPCKVATVESFRIEVVDDPQAEHDYWVDPDISWQEVYVEGPCKVATAESFWIDADDL